MTTTTEQELSADELDILYDGIIERLEEMAENNDLAALEKAIDDLSGGDRHHRNVTAILNLEAEIEELKTVYGAAGNQTKRKNAVEADHDRHRDLSLLMLNKREELSALKTTSARYRRVTAIAADLKAKVLNKQQQDAGTFLAFTEARIGNLENKGQFVDGTTEWLAQRTTGIGGSDVGPILKVGDKKYIYDNYRAIIESKVNPVFDMPEGDPLLTATGRGHAWEEHLRQFFAARHPEMFVWYTGNSYEHVDTSWVKANFDGLLSTVNDPAQIDGLLEIKTSSRPSDWGDTSLGYEGIPKNYFYQMLWYMYHARLEYGYLIVVINDTEVREYFFTMDDAGIQHHIMTMLTMTKAFWENEILNYTAPGANGKKPYNWNTTAGQARAWNTLSAITDCSVESLRSNPNVTDMEQSFDFIQNIKQTIEHRTRPFIVVDIETSSASPAYGRILELSVVRFFPDQPEVAPEVVFDSLFGLPDAVLHGEGVALSEVHRITPDMIDGKPLFEDAGVADELMTLFRSGTVVAHNKMFEERFFNVFIDGFGKAVRDGEITVLDTMDITKLGMPETKNDRLESFAEYNGVPYVDAHAALPDTMMTAVALRNFLDTAGTIGQWEPEFPSEAERAAAEERAANYVRG